MKHVLGAHTDHGTVIRPDHAALVVGPDGTLQLFRPATADESTAVSTNLALLISVAICSDDRAWVKDTIAVLER